MKENDIQKEIKYIEDELLRLKTPQGLVRKVDSFYYEFNNPSEKVKITYGNTKYPPVTRVSILGGFIFSPTFYMERYDSITRTQIVNLEYDEADKMLVFSTAPIEKVENIQ